MTTTGETDDQERGLGEAIARLGRRESLDAAAAEAAFVAVMEGRATPVQMAALLVALRVRGETAAEIAGGVRALRRAMVPVPVTPGNDVVDTCGTGGGALTTFNISTAAALVAAAAGVRIAKHGNRSFSSRCGSADVLEALGARIELSPDQMGAVLDHCGIVFMFAPLLHPAMRHVGPVRRELGMPTVMNVLGPLTNPAGAQRQVVGVADPRLLDLIAGGLCELGHTHALVVHGAPGLDELSPIGATEIREVRGGTVRSFRLSPDELGWQGLPAAELAGGDPDENARIIRGLLDGRIGGTARAATALNAGAAVYVAGLSDSISDGVRIADAAIDSGAAALTLHNFCAATQAV
jgi:anthranilate phosphoribosyltransferase